jgi:hypothetical protein
MKSEVICSLVAGILYINTIGHEFVYDDRYDTSLTYFLTS